MSYIELRFGSDVIHHLDVTDDRARLAYTAQPVTWTCPEIPDVSIDEDGALIERQDARRCAA